MDDFIGSLAECRRRLVLPEAMCHKYKFSLEWSKSLNIVTRGLIVLYGFVINIPSDRAMLKTKGGEEEERVDEDEDSEDE